jgi:hypothetical protein
MPNAHRGVSPYLFCFARAIIGEDIVRNKWTIVLGMIFSENRFTLFRIMP